MNNEAPERIWIQPNENNLTGVGPIWFTRQTSETDVEYRRVDPPAAPTNCKPLGYVYERPKEQQWCVTHNQPMNRCATPAAPADERDKAAYRTIEQLDGSVATFADTDWCSECHAYTHKPDCRSARLTARTPLADQIVNAVYRSMAQYEDATWFLDNLKAKARVNRLLATVRAEARAQAFTDGIAIIEKLMCPAQFEGNWRNGYSHAQNDAFRALESARTGKVGE